MRKGFSLSELMIIITVVGVLIAIAIPKFQQHKPKYIRTGIIEVVKTPCDCPCKEGK